MQRNRLKILGERPLMFARSADDSKKQVEHKQRDPARLPAAEKFSKDQMRPRYRFGQKGENGARLAFHRYLARCRGDRNYQR